MIVNYLDDSNCSHLFHVNPSVRFDRDRVMVGCEDQPVRMNEIDGILPDTISIKLMTPVRWDGRHHRQGRSRREHCETRHDRPRHVGAVCFAESIGWVECLGELSVKESNLHTDICLCYLSGNILFVYGRRKQAKINSKTDRQNGQDQPLGFRKRSAPVGFLRGQPVGRRSEAPFLVDPDEGVGSGCARTDSGTASAISSTWMDRQRRRGSAWAGPMLFPPARWPGAKSQGN